ncbi:unnamed protein product [Phytomonas sp. EM1]|nr:unnamed protein product [Phytomonas sp. EM1]|eukprot:CCW65667.1 unnamed protein product [Phytomonas sp. isolate EM1]
MLKFFKKPSREEEVRTWTRRLRSEQRKLDLQVSKINREEQKVKLAMKQAVKASDLVAARMLAKELIHSRKAVSRLYAAKAQMNSVAMQLQNQLSQQKLVGCMSSSAEIMKDMNALIKVKEVHEAMRELGKEIQKAGIIEEITNDVLDDALDNEISDSELEVEVNKVVEEVTQKQMEGARVGISKLPMKKQDEREEEEKESEEEAELMAKLNALRTS